ncbi:hypothetical protein HOY82DRAFT_477586 [Tuber indicum]|nr:hypothetical protein HOY82DRAFT_477586 [Tuber indicum]
MQATAERHTEERINHPMIASVIVHLPPHLLTCRLLCALDFLTIVLNFPGVQKIDIQVLTDHTE